MFTFILWILFCVLIAVWAGRLNRSGVIHFFVSFFLSPIIAAVILLILGKHETTESKEIKKTEFDALSNMIQDKFDRNTDLYKGNPAIVDVVVKLRNKNAVPVETLRTINSLM